MARFHKQEHLDLLHQLDGRGWIDANDIHLSRGDWTRLAIMERDGLVQKRKHQGGVVRGYTHHLWKIAEKGKMVLHYQ